MAVDIVRDVKIGQGAGVPRLVFGTVTLDGSNPTPVALSDLLSAIDAAVVNLGGTAAPGVDPTQLSSDISGATLNVYAWKVTSAMDPTLIASTDNSRAVHFMAIGPSK